MNEKHRVKTNSSIFARVQIPTNPFRKTKKKTKNCKSLDVSWFKRRAFPLKKLCGIYALRIFIVLKHCDFDGFLRLLPFYGSLFRITFTSRNFSLLFFEFLRVNFWKEFPNFLRKCTRFFSVNTSRGLRIRMTGKNSENPRDMICPEFHVIWSEFESIFLKEWLSWRKSLHDGYDCCWYLEI